MKRMLFALVFAILLTSCGEKTDGDPFSVFSGEFIATVSMVCEGNGSEYVYKSADKSIAFLTPTELTGYVMQSRDGKVYLSYGEVSVVLSEYASRLMLVNLSVFSARPEDIASINAEKGEGGTLTVVKTSECTYIFSSDGKPVSVSGAFDGIAFEMTFTDFSEASA